MSACSAEIQEDTRVITYSDGSKLKHVLISRDTGKHSIKFEVHPITGAHELLAHDVKMVICAMTLVPKGQTETEVTWCSQQLLKSDVTARKADAKTSESKRMESLNFFKNLFES